MRVQIRDCNPPHRGLWRYPRGRGRYQQYGSQRQLIEYEGAPNVSLKRGYETGIYDKHSSVVDPTQVPATEFPTLNSDPVEFSSIADHTCVDDGSNSKFRLQAPVIQSLRSSPEPGARGACSQFGDFREWYEDPTLVGPTPPSSSFGSSASTTAPPAAAPYMTYPLPNLGFYPPQPWMPPFQQHFSYPIPFLPGFPSFVPPSQHAFAGPAVAEAVGPATGVPTIWGGVGGVYTVCCITLTMMTP